MNIIAEPFFTMKMGTMEVVLHFCTLENQLIFTIILTFIAPIGMPAAQKCHNFRDKINGSLDLNAI
jgi:hypothetical protein